MQHHFRKTLGCIPKHYQSVYLSDNINIFYNACVQLLSCKLIIKSDNITILLFKGVSPFWSTPHQWPHIFKGQLGRETLCDSWVWLYVYRNHPVPLEPCGCITFLSLWVGQYTILKDWDKWAHSFLSGTPFFRNKAMLCLRKVDTPCH